MTTQSLNRFATPRFSGLLGRVASAYALYRQRRQLADLDAHLRADLGLMESDIVRETRRSVWDVPSCWRA